MRGDGGGAAVCFAGAAHIAHVVASDGYLPCEAAVHSWAIKETEIVDREVQLKSADGLQLRDLLFFLHIPRTGGRTYHQWYVFQFITNFVVCLTLEKTQRKSNLHHSAAQ